MDYKMHLSLGVDSDVDSEEASMPQQHLTNTDKSKSPISE